MAGFRAMRQDSDSELAGKLGASLTPSVAQVHTPRGEQSSGFFDLQSLYAMHVERVQATQAPPVVVMPVPRIAPPLQMRPHVTVPEPEIYYEVEFAAASARARAIPRPIGWYAVFVTWLVTVTLGVGAATQVPAHVSTRVHPATATATSTSTPTPTPTPDPSSSVPVFVISDLPRVQTKAPAAPTHARRVAPAPPPPSAPASEPASAPAPVAAVTKAMPPPAPAPPPATTAAATPAPEGTSLEDLIRREVAAEQKRIHAAKAQ